MVHFKPKRPFSPVVTLQGAIDEILKAHEETSLSLVLDKFNSPHNFERSEERNLLNWYKVLNRFDEILDRYISSRNILAKPAKDNQNSSSSQKVSTSSDHRSKLTAPPQYSASGKLTRAAGISSTNDGETSSKARSDPDRLPVSFAPTTSLVRLVLRVTQRLIRNASHDTRTVYNSIEHLGALLADDNSAIVLLTLEIISMLMQRSHKLRPTRTQINFELSDRLLDLAAGWGGRENRLGLLECCSAKSVNSLPLDGSRLHFEYTVPTSSGQNNQSSDEALPRREASPFRPSEGPGKKGGFHVTQRSAEAGPIPLSLKAYASTVPRDREPVVRLNGSVKSIIVPNVGSFPGSERWLLSDFAKAHQVPKNKLFSLMCAFRRAKGFSEGREARIELAVIRLYALTTLFHLQSLQAPLHDLIAKEPELLQDIVALASAGEKDGVEDIPRCLRIIAIRCLTAMSLDRNQFGSIMNATGVHAHHGTLQTLLRTEISSLLSRSPVASGQVAAQPDPMALDRAENADNVSAEECSRGDSCLTLLSESRRVPEVIQRILTTESLLALVHSLAVSAGSSGANPLANSGVLGILIPLLSDRDMRHSRVVSQAIRAMHSIIEGSQNLGCQLFRDHDGLRMVAKRIAAEVEISGVEVSEVEQVAADEAVEEAALKKRGESRELYDRLGKRQMTYSEAIDNFPPSSGTAARGLLPHSKWALIRALHQLLLRALGNGGNEVRELVVNSELPKALRKIMGQPFLHGGGLFQSAATVTTEIAHAEPTATAELVRAGLTSTVLRTIRLGLPPCGEAVRCIPNLLAALCLAPSARESIVNSKPLKLYLVRLATPFYTRALHGESPVIIGSALDELMRHVEALRPDGNEAMIEYLRLSAQFVESSPDSSRFASRVNSGNSIGGVRKSQGETMSSVPEKVVNTTSASSKGDTDKASPDAILLDRMKLAVANNSCRLAGFPQGSSEHQQGIVEKGGLDHMIKLRYAPALVSPEAAVREGFSPARHYPTPAHTLNSLGTSLRNLSSRHSSSVLKSLFHVILQDASSVLKIGKALGNSWLPEEDPTREASASKSKENAVSEREPSAQRQSMEGIQSESNGGILKSPHTLDVSTEREYGDCELTDVDPQCLPDNRDHLRANMMVALKKLRVGVELLRGLYTRGGPGTSAHSWESAKGSLVAAVVSTVERAARYHLAIVYTGLTLSASALSASSEGDLSTAQVTAAADPAMIPLTTSAVSETLGEIDKLLGWSVSTDESFKDACKKYKVPPKGHDAVRQDVKGLAWCLVTFAVSAQRLYSTLSKALTFSSRRLSRDPARYAASANAMAATIGRIFALHLLTTEKLWNIRVVSMGGGKVVAAWDYLRGVLIEMKGTLFDEPQRGTQSVILKSFLDAGGAEALHRAARPLEIVRMASSEDLFSKELNRLSGVAGSKSHPALEEMLRSQPLVTMSYTLALSDIAERIKNKQAPKKVSKQARRPHTVDSEGDDTGTSTDSVSHQARGISRIVVSEGESDRGQGSITSTDEETSRQEFLGIISNASKLRALRAQVDQVKKATIKHCAEVAIRRVVSDVWNTLCNFLYLFGTCPRLLNPGSSHIPDSPLPGTDWEPWEIQRSALTVTLNLLVGVTKSPSDLLAAFRPDGSGMHDVLGIIHTTSQVAQELSKKRTNEGNNGMLDESEDFLEREEDVPPPRRTTPDPDMLRSLVEMGFSERLAAHALRRTAPGGLEYAAEWLLSHREDDEDSESVDTDEAAGQRDWDEGDEQDDEEGDPEDGQNEEDNEDTADNDDEDEGQDDDAEIEPAVDSERNSTGHEEAMVDSEPEQPDDAGHSDSGDPNPVSSGSVEGSEEGTPRFKKAGQHARVSQYTSSSRPKLSIMEDGLVLLRRCLSTEQNLLSSAIDKSTAFTSKGIRNLCELMTSLSEIKSVTNYAGDRTGSKDAPSTIPASVDEFADAKKELFESLLPVIREVIQSSSGHTHGRHLPYLAIELLSIIQKDGTLREEETKEFAALLKSGLELYVSKRENAPEENAGVLAHTAAIWSHYGGNHARRALQACGTFQLAMDCIFNVLEKWQRAVSGPQVDIEATQPIQKLSIRERSPEIISTVPDVKTRQGKSTKSLARMSLSTKSKLRTVSKNEAQELQIVTICILHLDALIRYDAKDKIIQKTNETRKAKEDDSGRLDKGSGVKQSERMETEETSAAAHNDRPTQPPNRVRSENERTAKALNDIIRDVFGSSSSAMEVDLKSLDGDIDLKAARESGEACKAEIINSARTAITSWITKESNKGDFSGLQKKLLMTQCITMLKLWTEVEVGDALLSVLQLMGSLTSDWDLARMAADKGTVELLLNLPHLRANQSRSTDFKIVRSLTKTILRHIVEDPETLEEAMVAELRSLMSSGQPRTRPPFTMKTLLTATSPLAARNMQCYISALTTAVRGNESERRGELQLAEYKMKSTSAMERLLEKRRNVRMVISAVSSLISEDSVPERSGGHASHSEPSVRSEGDTSLGLSRFALDILSDFVEFSQIAAVAFIRTPSPSRLVEGSALDYVIQNILPVRYSPVKRSSSSIPQLSGEREELSKAARNLFLSLCSKTAHTHEESVISLARAVKLEADKSEVSPDVLTGLAQCVAPNTKLRVLRVMLDCGMGNDLARSLRSLDLSVERNFEVAMNVLRALSLIGQAATHLARHGTNTPDGISFGSSSGRHPWGALRERDYMVL
eukprot:GFKZ01011734.1.p1 GENE.GFKZ01011734.1~~GFKZ01011734.1.p1  ORF type:complete len:2709 (-),score=326.66 GFKZ01011734.1:600-8726(-)